jgi:hypothetical protein
MLLGFGEFSGFLRPRSLVNLVLGADAIDYAATRCADE